MTLGKLCEFKVNFPEANFWLIRKGSENVVGSPTKEFSSEHIGVKVLNEEILNPDFLYYYFTFLQQKGVFTQLAFGTLKLKHIRISEIKDIPIVFK